MRNESSGEGWHSLAPPSVLPDISPTGGKIGYHAGFAKHQRCKGRRGAETANLPPAWGRCPAGQRGALSRRPV
ncbi:MAG: hypothetical protein EOQ96_31260 [Mesorhizobium sp.]|nr:MAG: hypothetical protein EOQ96_31260 [Mesorhizobium sp.]